MTGPLARANRMYADVLAGSAAGTASPAPTPRVSRRVLFAAAGVTLLAGCGSTSTTAGANPGGSATLGRTSTGTPSPGPSTTPAAPPTPTGPPPLPVQTRPQFYVHAGPKAVALTLDDGPSEYTEQILDILRAHHVTATFCMIGRQIAGRASVVREVAAAGHHITNHTWDHADQSRLTLPKVAAQIARTTEAMTDVGITPTMFRAPYGAWSHTVFEATAAAGLHALVTLRSDGPTEEQVLNTCARHGLGLRGLSELHHDPADRPQGLLVGFGAPSERAYPAALDALSAALAAAGVARG